MPWYTYPAIDWLERLDVSSCSVFEWGLGYSTLYWERRGCQVVGVDDSPAWHARVDAVTSARCILTADQPEYVRAHGANMFDIVCIDGAYRDECAAAAPAIVADGGLIVFDNSDRHPGALRSLRDTGWLQIDFVGLGPLNAYHWTTSVLLRGSIGFPYVNLPAATY